MALKISNVTPPIAYSPPSKSGVSSNVDRLSSGVSAKDPSADSGVKFTQSGQSNPGQINTKNPFSTDPIGAYTQVWIGNQTPGLVVKQYE